MTSGYKKPGILRASFDYQDLAAIQVLIAFYRQPDLYEWVEIDSDDREHASIDDIVACRRDGRFEVTQVKFTVDPDDPGNRLSWDWLLQSKPHGKSLLQKWSATVRRHARADCIERAELFTDRRPETSFEAVLDGERIEFDRVALPLRARIEEQLGSSEDARLFFEHFRFRHSQPHLADFEFYLQSALIPSDTDYAGWVKLVSAVRKWATLKNRPEPDGRVRHAHIRAIISRERPRPLAQNFDVPAGYRPPDQAFDRMFLKRIVSEDGITVVWGPPGRGKSTYLSHCFAELRKAEQLCIRHHYFLRLSDRGTERFFFQEIERSLTRQIAELFPEVSADGNSLGSALDAASALAGQQGERLIVMVDGLDHVWREGRSLDHMQQVFAHLLPTRPNIHLVVGTQKIAHRNLPQRLLQYCPEDEWFLLPLMSTDAIAHWLTVQRDAGRLQLPEAPAGAASIRTLANALHRVTGGLPLQLIYAFEEVTRSGGLVTEEKVQALPASPSGDVRDYYRGLWSRISPTARSILHGLAALTFPLAPGSLLQCFSLKDGTPEAIEEIDHLLDHRETGIFPFHGSMFVFVREQSGHVDGAAAIEPMILQWLNGPAPAYWKWAWTWIAIARFGDPVPLRDGPDRAWALEALRAGQPPEQIELILREAEDVAFRALDLGRTLELRSIWIRLSNAPEFQTHRFADFVEATLRRGAGDHRLVDLRARLSEQTAETLLALLRALAPEAASVIAPDILRELNRRVIETQLLEHSNREDFGPVMARVVSYIPDFDLSRFKNFVDHSNRADALVATAAREAILSERYAQARAIAALRRGPQTDAALFSIFCLDGGDPRAVPAFKRAVGKARMTLLLSLRGVAPRRNRPLGIDVSKLMSVKYDHEIHAAIAGHLPDIFFEIAAASLRGRGERVEVMGFDTISDGWLRRVVDRFTAMAKALAERLDRGEPAFTIADFLTSLSLPWQDTLNHETLSGVRVALREIMRDLQLLRRASDPALGIGPEDFPAEGRFWDDVLWLEHSADHRFPLHSTTAAAALLDRVDARLATEVTEYIERSNLCISAALFALDHQLISRADTFLARSARCLLGYGTRKDIFAFEILEALSEMAAIDRPWVVTQLLRLAPAYEAIGSYTDGDETRYARSDFHKLFAEVLPDRIGPLYGALVCADDWASAEQLLLAVADGLDPADPRDRALLTTFIQPKEFSSAQALAERHGPAGADLSRDLNQRVGYSRKLSDGPPYTTPSESERRPRSAPKPRSFPPDRLDDYREAIAKAPGYSWQGDELRRWLRYWQKAGKGLEALAALRKLVLGDHSGLSLETLYDDAFDISLALEGRDAAFFWLVAGQRHRHGWSRWFTSNDETERRLDKAGNLFPERWREFLVASAEPVFRGRSEPGAAVIGQSRLVYFLLRAGQPEEARLITEKLIALMLDEVDEQPIAAVEWAQ